MGFNDFLAPVLSPLLEAVGPFWTIVIVSFFVSLLTTLVYKYTTNQVKMRKLKADLKRHQKKAQKLQKEDPKKAMEVQKKMMKLNGQYMKLSFRSTLYTFLPVILFFGWLSVYLSFAPLLPGNGFDVSVNTVPGTSGTVTLDIPEAFTINGNTTKNIVNQSTSWRLSAPSPGSYNITVRHDRSEEEFSIPLTIGQNYGALAPVIVVDGVALDSITIGYSKLKVFENIPVFGSIPWVNTWGWLGAYIFFSLLFSTVMRKALRLA